MLSRATQAGLIVPADCSHMAKLGVLDFKRAGGEHNLFHVGTENQGLSEKQQIILQHFWDRSKMCNWELGTLVPTSDTSLKMLHVTIFRLWPWVVLEDRELRSEKDMGHAEPSFRQLMLSLLRAYCTKRAILCWEKAKRIWQNSDKCRHFQLRINVIPTGRSAHMVPKIYFLDCCLGTLGWKSLFVCVLFIFGFATEFLTSVH